MFVKPADAEQYLHRRSFHHNHMSKRTSFSQYRRAVLICTDTPDRVAKIERMTDKVLRSGYQFYELYHAEPKALSLSTANILNNLNEDSNTIISGQGEEQKAVTFVFP